MKATFVTITATAVVPEGHVPEGLTLPDFAYRAATGLMALQTLKFKARPATREETDRNADFLAEWALSLQEFEHAMDSGDLPATRRVGNFAREMAIEPDGDNPAASWRSALELIAKLGGHTLNDSPCDGAWCAEQARSALETVKGQGVNVVDEGGKE